MKRIMMALLCSSSALALADSCLQTDKKGNAGDSRYYDYGKCTPQGSTNNYGSLNAIGQQLQGMMAKDSNDRGYSDAERDAFRRSQAEFAQGQDRRRAGVKYGATVELNMDNSIDYSRYQLQNAVISADQQQAIRNEIGNAISEAKLLDLYGNQGYDNPQNPATWASKDPAVRWKACEVATQMSSAYAFGNYIRPEQKDPAKGLAIAKAGYAKNCGGTAYWLGRIYEEGDKLVAGIDKNDLGKSPKSIISDVYDVAILNNYTPAFERMAELYRLDGPARYRGKTYYSFPSDFLPYWSNYPKDDKMYMMKVQYGQCLQAEPANLVCARGLQMVFSDTSKSYDYTNYNQKLADYYGEYVKKLEALLAKAGQPVPAAN